MIICKKHPGQYLQAESANGGYTTYFCPKCRTEQMEAIKNSGLYKIIEQSGGKHD